MNTCLFCKELEKKFGHFKKYNIKNWQTVITRNIEFLLSPFSMFLYKISLYLQIDLSHLKNLLQSDCEQLLYYCNHVYRRFKKNSVANVVSMVLHHKKSFKEAILLEMLMCTLLMRKRSVMLYLWSKINKENLHRV